MARTLSEQLLALAEHAKHAEESVASASKTGKEHLEERVAKIKSAASERTERLADDVESGLEDVGSKWRELRERVKGDIEERRFEHDAQSAAKKADKAELNAEFAIAFALDAIDSAEIAAINALLARAEADSYSD